MSPTARHRCSEACSELRSHGHPQLIAGTVAATCPGLDVTISCGGLSFAVRVADGAYATPGYGGQPPSQPASRTERYRRTLSLPALAGAQNVTVSFTPTSEYYDAFVHSGEAEAACGGATLPQPAAQ